MKRPLPSYVPKLFINWDLLRAKPQTHDQADTQEQSADPLDATKPDRAASSHAAGFRHTVSWL
jgi:hypothetical protein